MSDRSLSFFLTGLLLLFFGLCVWCVPYVYSRGGEGIGITCEPDSVGQGGEGSGPGFEAMLSGIDRIDADITLLVSESFANQGRQMTHDEVVGYVVHSDSLTSNEYGLELHDFGLIYNYFTRPSHNYGDPAWGLDNAVFFEDSSAVPHTERNHVDCYLAMHGVDATGGVTNSVWTDPDEDPGSPEWHYNSFNCTDGDSGKAKGNQSWYVSGSHANLMFNHEFQHICYYSNTGMNEGGWPNEMLSTGGEYLSGVSSASYFWEPVNDVTCDGTVANPPQYSPYRPELFKAFGMWRLFAAYLFHQFNPDESEYTDDLVYKWVSKWQQHGDATYPGLYALAKELEEDSTWASRFPATDGVGRLRSLFQDWAIAKAINDSTMHFTDESVTLGFKRGLSPYYDIGLFRDVDTSCCAPNSRVLPHQHLVQHSCLDNFTWVTSYTAHEDSIQGDCDCQDIYGHYTLRVADKVDTINVPTWGSDYVLFQSDESFGSGGPYDLKIKIRGERNRPPFNLPRPNTQIQVSVLTYSSPDSVFRTSDNLIEIRRIDINPDSAKANVTICGFGDPVKAVVLIIGLVCKTEGSGGSDMDYADLWDYKYGYTVEKHWKSGLLPAWNVAWFDSIHVNGDVVVKPGWTVTVEPGTRVEFYPGDTQNWGVDPNRCEFVLTQGGSRLVAEGAPNDTIRFTSGASSPMPYDWYGVTMVKEAGAFEPKYCKFEYAAYPIICSGNSLAISSCVVRSFGCEGIRVADTSCVTLQNSTIDMSNGSVGIVLRANSSGIVSGNTIMGSGTGTAAVQTTTGSSVTLDHNTITSVYTGISASGGSLSSSHNKISGFQNDGIKASGSTVNISYDTLDIGSTGVRGIELADCPSGDVSHNLVTASPVSVRYGMKCSGSTSVSVSYNRFEDVCIGLAGSGTSVLDITDNVLTDNSSTGVRGEGSSRLDVKGNSITGYDYYGVTIKNTAYADLGAQPDSGLNRIFTESMWTDYCVMNKTASTVMAEYNWWGTSQPTQSLFYGSVDWSPYLIGDPGPPFALKMPGQVLGVPPVAYTVQNYPNPLNPVTTIEYGVPEDGMQVTVRVFDVSGRLLRLLVDRRELAGVHTVSWDGRSEDGRRVASGVYLYEALIGEYRVSKKMVVLR